MMTFERAIEILDPEHREHYDDIEEVNEACRMGMEALKAFVNMPEFTAVFFSTDADKLKMLQDTWDKIINADDAEGK